ncbi:glutathione S-transferase theta-1-like [Pelodytes ibericus]
MVGLTIYLDLLSQPCRSVYIFTKANNIPFQNQEVKLFTGAHLTEDFRKVNAFGRVPALKDEDFTLSESTAILLYLTRKFNTPDHWYPSDLQKRARVDEYLAWQHTNTRPHGSKVFWAKRISKLLTGQEASSEKLDPILADFNTTMANLEKVFLQDKPFLVGDEISVADLVAIVEIMQAVAAGLDVFEERPKLAAWKQRVVEAVGEDLFNEAHEQLLSAKPSSEPVPPELLEKLKDKLAIIIN